MILKLFGKTIVVPDASKTDPIVEQVACEKERHDDLKEGEDRQLVATPGSSTVAEECEKDNKAVVAPAVDDEQEVWNYEDPHGTTRGPFSMTQLRKWCSKGMLPKSLRVWKSWRSHTDSIELSELLLLPTVEEASAVDGSSRIWLYEDSSGVVQGPVSLDTLKNKKLNFPSDLKIWKTSQGREGAVLLKEEKGHPQEEVDNSKDLDTESCSSANKTTSSSTLSASKRKRGSHEEFRESSVERASRRAKGYSDYDRRSEYSDYNMRKDKQYRRSSTDGDAAYSRRHDTGTGWDRYTPRSRSTIPCKYYKRGYCRNGSTCLFSHHIDKD